LNSCYWDGSATTVESYTEVSLLTTSVTNVWQLQASGAALSLGEGGDFASGNDCFDDPLRGGFRVDLNGTGLQFYEAQATVTVSGYSPVLRMMADGVIVEEWRRQPKQNGTTTTSTAEEYTMTIPAGTVVVEVACGGWPANCTSNLFVTLA
jgi:hypothetical protein